MSEWITDRLPMEEDAGPAGLVWATYDGKVDAYNYDGVFEGTPWMRMIVPEPYVKPKRYKVVQLDNAEWAILRIADDKYVAHSIIWNAREAAERIAAIYEEVMP